MLLTYQRSCEKLAKEEIMKIGLVKKQFKKESGQSQSAQKWQVWQHSFLPQGFGMPVEWFFFP